MAASAPPDERPEPAAVDATRDEHDNERELVDVGALSTASARPASAAPAAIVRGRVLLPGGQPAAGADVRAGNQSANAADDGAFTLEVRSRDDDLAAWLVGYQPVIVADVAQLPDVVAARAIDVMLPGTALTIDGWLVAADGTPAKGWHVHLHGGATPVDDSELPVLTAEDFAAGVRDPEDRNEQRPRRISPNLLEIGDDGAFLFGGLRRGQDYVLRAWNEDTLQTALSPPLRAGTRGYRFSVPPGSFREHVRGRAIDRHGGPIAGVRVRLTMRVHKSGHSESYETGQSVQADADGRFAFTQVIREDLLLRFDGEHVVSHYHEFRANDPGDDVLVRLGMLCRFRVEPDPDAIAPASFRVLDAQQQPLRLTRQVMKETQRALRIRIAPDDPWRDMTVSDEAAWLLFEVAEREVRRVPLQLRRGELNVVRG